MCHMYGPSVSTSNFDDWNWNWTLAHEYHLLQKKSYYIYAYRKVQIRMKGKGIAFKGGLNYSQKLEFSKECILIGFNCWILNLILSAKQFFTWYYLNCSTQKDNLTF